MRPILFDTGLDLPLLGPLNFPAYFTMLALSFGVGMWMVWREAPRLGMDRERALDLTLWMVVWGIVGARVLHVIADGHFWDYVHLCTDPTKVPATEALVKVCKTSAECGYDYLCNAATSTCHPPRDCLAAVKVWRGGLAFYGGFLFAAAFGLALTRMGCFLNGCCFGQPSDLPWAVHFRSNKALEEAQEEAGQIALGATSLPVHPTQIYLAALMLLSFALLYFWFRPRKRFHGEVFAWLLILKGVFRSLVEVWRADERGVLFGWLSTSQIISVPVVALGIWLLVRNRRRPEA